MTLQLAMRLLSGAWSRASVATCYCPRRYGHVDSEESSEQQASSTSASVADIWPRVPSARTDLVQALLNGVLYNEDGIVALSKPYGISGFGMTEDLKKRYVERENELETLDRRRLAVYDVLPELADALFVERLTIVKSFAQNCDGIMLLASTTDSAKKLRRAVIRAQSEPEPYIRMAAICVGRPEPRQDKEAFFIGKHTVNDRVYYTIVQDATRSQRKKGHAMKASIEYMTLVESCQCSLVSLGVNRTKWFAPRMILAHRGCPVMGDSTFQKRVAKVMGKAVIIQPERASLTNQFIPVHLMRRLGLSLKDYHQLPLFLHMQCLSLKDVLPNSRKLTIENRIPLHFLSVLKLLGFYDAYKANVLTGRNSEHPDQ